MSYEEVYTVKSDNTLPLGINISRLHEVKVMVLFADMILTDLAKNVHIINLVHLGILSYTVTSVLGSTVKGFIDLTFSFLIPCGLSTKNMLHAPKI